MDLFHFNYWCLNKNFSLCKNCISGIMVSVLTSSAVDREFEHRSGKTKDYKIDICCYKKKGGGSFIPPRRFHGCQGVIIGK
jgi:hypothetical protein